ncbi:MAG: hypothetical protein U0235_18530 [Polyangiaceae bacterium]
MYEHKIFVKCHLEHLQLRSAGVEPGKQLAKKIEAELGQPA